MSDERKEKKRNLGKERYRITGYSIYFFILAASSIFNYVKFFFARFLDQHKD